MQNKKQGSGKFIARIRKNTMKITKRQLRRIIREEREIIEEGKMLDMAMTGFKKLKDNFVPAVVKFVKENPELLQQLMKALKETK